MHSQTERATPRQSKGPIFRGNWGDSDGGSGYFVSFSLCFGATTKKGVNFFVGGGRKVYPRENPGYAYGGEKRSQVKGRNGQKGSQRFSAWG